MTSFHDIVQACGEEGIAVSEVDRVLVSAETYSTFQDELETRDVETSNYQTIDGPAVRETTGEEKLVYIDESGREREITLD